MGNNMDQVTRFEYAVHISKLTLERLGPERTQALDTSIQVTWDEYAALNDLLIYAHQCSIIELNAFHWLCERMTSPETLNSQPLPTRLVIIDTLTKLRPMLVALTLQIQNN